jgi:hypothetical protein
MFPLLRNKSCALFIPIVASLVLWDSVLSPLIREITNSGFKDIGSDGFGFLNASMFWHFYYQFLSLKHAILLLIREIVNL